MTDADQAGRPLPALAPAPVAYEPVPHVVAAPGQPIGKPSAKKMFGRGLLLITAEMVQLVLALALVIFVLACCVALAVQANDAYNFMGEKFVTPHAVVAALGSMLEWTPTFLIICLLASVFAIKLLDLVVRVLRRRARLAELYPA